MTEIKAHGTAELRTERLLLRRYRPEDAPALYRKFGSDTAMYRYSGWNPYATPEAARENVDRHIAAYDDVRFYGWAIEAEGALRGTIGAYDYEDDRIEVGFSIERDCWGKGYSTESLKAVLNYLTEEEGIRSVIAWCADENIGSQRVLEKAGMRLKAAEKDGLVIGENIFDKLTYEYRGNRPIEGD